MVSVFPGFQDPQQSIIWIRCRWRDTFGSPVLAIVNWHQSNSGQQAANPKEVERDLEKAEKLRSRGKNKISLSWRPWYIEMPLMFATLTTTASSPTICRTVNSLVLNVGRIHPKKVSLECTSCGENPLSNVLGMYRTFDLVRKKQKDRKDTIPTRKAIASCVCSHGPGG